MVDSSDVHVRVGHIAVAYKHFMLVWGGLKRVDDAIDISCPTDQIWFYNCTTEVWNCVLTKGIAPIQNSGATAVICDDDLYIYGGVEHFIEDLYDYSNNLQRLDLKAHKWFGLSPSGIRPLCCDKGAGWSYGGKIYTFGGYGSSPPYLSDKFTFDPDPHNMQGERGWHNQLAVYDPASNSWSLPKTNGLPPTPRATHAVDLSGDKVYIFGGRTATGRVSDLYRLDLITLTWQVICLRGGLSDVPEGRSWHSFNFTSELCAIVYGGLNQQGFPCTDWWECRIQGDEVCWVDKGRMQSSLVWHRAVFSHLTKELIIVGGVTCSPYTMLSENYVRELLIFKFSPASLLRLCLQTVLSERLWPNSNLPACLLEMVKAREDPTIQIS